MSKSKRIPTRYKVALELLYHRLGHRYTKSFSVGYTANVWKDIELRIDPDPFCASFQISTINEKSIFKNPLKSKSPFKWFFVGIIPETATKFFTNATNFYKYL